MIIDWIKCPIYTGNIRRDKGQAFQGVPMLNKELYARLEAEFGRVKILKENQKPTYDKEPTSNGWKITKVYESGEEFYVCCPFCSDTRFRLAIPHFYGLRLKSGNSTIQFPTYAWCFNETHCLANFQKAKDLRRVILQGDMPLLMRRTYNKKATSTTKKIVFPKNLQRFPDLPESNQGKQYLRSRGYNIDFLDTVGFRWVPEDPHPIVEKSIFIPIFDHNGELVGGQCRLPHQVEGNFPPKYYTLPNSTLSKTLYNLWRVRGDIVVVTEGVFDALSLNRLGVGVLGSHISKTQTDLLAQKDIVIFALDPDIYDEPSKKRNFLDTAETLQNKRVIIEHAQIPEGEDPDSLTPNTRWSIIENALQRAIERQS